MKPKLFSAGLVLASCGLIPMAGRAAPLIYEGFSYTPGETLGADDNGGSGFGTPWRGSASLVGPVDSEVAVAAGSLTPSASPFLPTGERAGHGGGGAAAAFRTMATGLNMNANEDYFVSFLFDMAPNAATGLAGLSFFAEGSEEVFFGWSAQASMGWAVGQLGGLATGDFYNQVSTYFLVGKIQARSGSLTGPGFGDQLFLEAYAPGETVPATEPASYSVVGNTTENISSTLNILSIFSDAPFVELDEIRVGETWTDVATVPEPSSGMLLAFAALAASHRSRAHARS